MTNKAIIFDLDGTLLNTLEDLAESGNRLRAEHGLAGYPIADYALFVGNGMNNLVRRIMPEGAEGELASWLSRFTEIYHENWRRNCCLYPGIDDMMSRLAGLGLPLAILSNKPHDFALLFVEHFFAGTPFAIVRGQQAGIPKKPDPSSTRQILQQLDCEAECSVFVGDSGVDMQTGTAAGMYCVGVSWGFRSVDELRSSGADKIIDSPLQLVDYVATLT